MPPPHSLTSFPAAAAVTDGLGAVNDSGVRSRGLTLATPRGARARGPGLGRDPVLPVRTEVTTES